MELGSHSWIDCLTAELFPNSCFSDTVFGTFFRTAVETAVSGVRKLIRTGGVPTSLTLFFWRWLTISSVFTGGSAGTSYSWVPDPPSPSLISHTISADVQHHDYLLTYGREIQCTFQQQGSRRGTATRPTSALLQYQQKTYSFFPAKSPKGITY